MIAFNNARLPILNIYKPLDVTGLSRVNEDPLRGEIILIRGHFVPSISDTKLKFHLNLVYLFKIRPIHTFSPLFNLKCKMSDRTSRISIRSNLFFSRSRLDEFNSIQLEAEFSVLFPEGLRLYPELTLREDHGRPTYAVACFSHLPYKTLGEKRLGRKRERERELFGQLAPKRKKILYDSCAFPLLDFLATF